MELNYTKQSLLDLFTGARDLVLKTITAKQVMMGAKKRGNQIINNSDGLVEKTIDGVQYLGNGYLFIKKGIDKNIDALFEKYSDMVSAYEYKGRSFYSGKKEDYELVTEIDLRTEQALLKTNKTTQIVTGDDYDRYHAFINSHYYRYFEKIIGSIRVGTPVEPVHIFDKNDEYIGSIRPIRSELKKREEFFYQPTMEEFLEGEKIEKERKEYFAKQDIEDKINQFSETLPKRAEIILEQCKDVATSELKIIKNKKGWYGIGFDTNHKGNEMVMEVFGEKNYKEYIDFWEKAHSKELAERLLEIINNSKTQKETTTEEKKEEGVEMTQQYNKTDIKKALNKLASRLEKMEVRTEDAIMEMVYDVVPKAFEIEYNKEDNYIFFYADADYTGKKPTKKEMLEIDSSFKTLGKIDGLGFCIEEMDEKFKLTAHIGVEYKDKYGYSYGTNYNLVDIEKEKEEIKQIRKTVTGIVDYIEEMEYFVYNIIVNTNKENCVFAVVENKYRYTNITGLYGGADRGNESIILAKKLAEYYEVEVIDACGMDVNELADKKYLDTLAELDKPCEMVSIKEKLGSLLNDEDKYMVEVIKVDTFEVVQEHFAKNLKELENLQNKLYKEIDIHKYYLKTVYLEQLKEGEVEVMTEEKNINMEELPMEEETDEKEVNDFIDLPFNEDDVEVTLRRNKDNKSVKMSDYVKYGLDEFEDKQTGSLVITPAQMKEKTWQGLTVESAVEELLEENKDYECKLFNEKYIKEPHYVVFNKNTKIEEVDMVTAIIKNNLKKAIDALENKVETFEELQQKMDSLIKNIELLSVGTDVMPIMDIQVELFHKVLDEEEKLQKFRVIIKELTDKTDLFNCSDYDILYITVNYDVSSWDCFEYSLEKYVEELKKLISSTEIEKFVEEIIKIKEKK